MRGYILVKLCSVSYTSISSREFFGSGSGTYTASGNTVITYIDGEEYLRYEVLSLTENACEVIMSITGASETLRIKCVEN